MAEHHGQIHSPAPGRLMSEAAGLSAKHEPPGSNAKASYNEPGSVTTELCLIIHSHREREVERGGEREERRERGSQHIRQE